MRTMLAQLVLFAVATVVVAVVWVGICVRIRKTERAVRHVAGCSAVRMWARVALCHPRHNVTLVWVAVLQLLAKTIAVLQSQAHSMRNSSTACSPVSVVTGASA